MSPAARTSRIERNLRLYPVVQAIVFTPVMLPIIVLFWEDNGLDMLEVFVLQGLFAVAMAVAEVPTGMVADRLGKKTSLTAGVLIVLVGMFVYGLGHGFAAFLAAEELLALGIALLSGADSSLLYDSLDALGRTAEYTRREGRARSVQMVSFAASNLLGGVIGSYDYRAAVWASMIGPAIALFVVLQLTEVQPVQRTTGFSEAWRGYRSLVGQTLKFVRKHALVRWYIVLLAVMGMGQTWLLWLYQPYMAHVELPVWSFGIAFAGFNLFAAFASHRAAEIDEWLSPSGTLVLLATLQVAPPLLMAVFVHPAAVFLILGHQGARGLGKVILSERVLRYTYPDKRSTVLSVSSLAVRLSFAISAPAMGWVARRYELPTTLLVQGAAAAALFAVLSVAYRRIDPKYFRVKDR